MMDAWLSFLAIVPWLLQGFFGARLRFNRAHGRTYVIGRAELTASNKGYCHVEKPQIAMQDAGKRGARGDLILISQEFASEA
jgi:hypothetical protein